jgi:hypothetical protein
MSTLSATVQSDRTSWSDARVGAFTASSNGDLMTEPRSKAAKEAGEMSETAKSLIYEKATELIKGSPVRRALTYDMKRGMALEHSMRYLLNEYWKPVDRTSLQKNGIWMSTPDGLLTNGEPLDIKCPGEVEVVRFADEVVDGDWNSMLKFNKGYAYQLLTQAVSCGTTYANIAYCTDKIKARKLSEKDVAMIFGEGLHDEHSGLLAQACQEIFDESGHVFEYLWHDRYSEPGFFFAVRRFEIPQEQIERMGLALQRAYAERDKYVDRLSKLIAA